MWPMLLGRCRAWLPCLVRQRRTRTRSSPRLRRSPVGDIVQTRHPLRAPHSTERTPVHPGDRMPNATIESPPRAPLADLSTNIEPLSRSYDPATRRTTAAISPGRFREPTMSRWSPSRAGRSGRSGCSVADHRHCSPSSTEIIMAIKETVPPGGPSRYTPPDPAPPGPPSPPPVRHPAARIAELLRPRAAPTRSREEEAFINLQRGCDQ